MRRVYAPDHKTLSPEILERQKQIAESGRDIEHGPFSVLNHSLDLAERIAKVGSYFRFEGDLPLDVRALVGLMVGRMYNCQFEWGVHVPAARDAGISDEIIDQIRRGERPTDLDSQLELVYRFGEQLLTQTHHVDDDIYEAVHEHFGTQLTVDLATCFGYLVMISFPMNSAKLPPLEQHEILPI